jgi:hypothetical protein
MEHMMPYVRGKCKLMRHPPRSRKANSNNVVYFGQHFYQFFKTTLDIGICALNSPSLCRLFVFQT